MFIDYPLCAKHYVKWSKYKKKKTPNSYPRKFNILLEVQSYK